MDIQAKIDGHRAEYQKGINLISSLHAQVKAATEITIRISGAIQALEEFRDEHLPASDLPIEEASEAQA